MSRNTIPKYNFKTIEKKWQKAWTKEKIYQPDMDKARKPFYNLMMFPYPSAEGLHVGSVYTFSGVDTYGRFKKLQGYDVFEPIGLDGFGIHSENYAMKIGQHILDVSKRTEKNFYRQLHEIGNMYDWSRTVETYKPEYYKWTQWIFLKMFEKGLAYRKMAKVNWCPSCKTVLSDEQVIGGRCERCDSEVNKKELAQWFFRITEYAERLLKNLDWIDWPEDVKTNQRNWIGKSEGALIKFRISNSTSANKDAGHIEVFTTRPDTLFGATYLVVAPEHEIIKKNRDKIENISQVLAYVEKAIHKSEQERKDEGKEKTGVELKGLKAVNPATNEEIPVWVADYVLGGYGTGAIMAVPAHDERDFDFAKKFKLPVVQVVARPDLEPRSYLMGGDAISDDDLHDLGIKILGRNDHARKLEIPKDKLQAYVRLVKEKLSPGFWNEIVGERVQYIFKEKDGKIMEFVLSRENEKDISRLAAWFNDREPKETDSKWRMLAENDFYTTHVIHHNDGIAVNSGFLDGLTTDKAKKEIVKWLVKNKIGKSSVDYKLRDWCISRQRYWGPPIPVVWCKRCALKQGSTKADKKSKIKVLIIHGFEGSGKGNWFPWMKQHLEKLGFEVYTPTLKSSAHPTVEQWMEELKPYMDKLDEHSVIIGHSLGSKAALHLLERSDRKISKLFMVASALDNPKRDWQWLKKQWTGSDVEALRKFWEVKIDWQPADANADKKYIIISNDDQFIDPDHYKVTKLTNLEVEKWDRQGHMTQPANRKLLDYIVDQVMADIEPAAIPVPEKDLPVKLPPMKDFLPEGKGKGPLAKNKQFLHTACPVCGGPAERETDVSDPFVDSAWYFFRYPSTESHDRAFDKKRTKKWLPVDSYIGGKEHTVLHLLYSRFVTMVFNDLGYIDFEEPYKRFYGHGLITKDGAKMSKSKGNVVNPDEMLAKYGADTVRLYLRFLGDFSQGGDWRDSGVEGMSRFVKKLWKLFFELEGNGSGQVKTNMIDKTVKVIGEDIDRLSFNTAVARLMEFVNWIKENEKSFDSKQAKQIKETLAFMLAPMAPHIAEEFWAALGNKKSIFQERWPKYDAGKLVEDEIELIVQVNGKLRDRLKVPKDISEDQAKKAASESERVCQFIQGKQVKKIIYVPGRLVNIVAV